MRLLCIYKHYYPDATAYGLVLKGIAEHVASEGNSVTVYTAQPSYNDVEMEAQPDREKIAGVDIIRGSTIRERKKSKLVRLASFSTFLIGALFHVLRRRRDYDIVLFGVHPAILMGVTGRIMRFVTGIPFVYHCQDIQPESLRLANRFNNKILYKFVRHLDCKTSLAAARNVVLSDDMKKTMIKRGIPSQQVSVVRNFEFDPVAQDRQTLLPLNAETEHLFSEDHFVVLFAGNFGNFQNLPEVCKAAELLKTEKGIRFVFLGAGSAQATMQSILADQIGKSVFFVPYQPVEVATAAMQRADLGLVSLHPGICQAAFPSKTIMYLRAGCPVLAVVEHESNLAQLVRDNSLGTTCPQGDSSRIADAILQMYEQRSHLDADYRNRLKRQGERIFGRDQILQQWSSLFAEVAAAQKPPFPVSVPSTS